MRSHTLSRTTALARVFHARVLYACLLFVAPGAFAAPPQVVGTIGSVSVSEDTPTVAVSVSGVFTDPDAGDSHTVTASSSQPFVRAQNTLQSLNGTLSFTIDPNANGDATITVVARDAAGGTAQTVFTLTVVAVNDPPFVADPLGVIRMIEDDPNRLIDLAPVFDDPDITTNGDALTFAVVSVARPQLFDSVTFNPQGSSILEINLARNRFGNSQITVSATDSGGLTTPYTFTVQIAELAPDAVDDTATILEDDPAGFVLIDVLANDRPGDPPATLNSVGTTYTDPSGVEYTGVSSGPPTTQPDGAGDPVTAPNGSITIENNQAKYFPKANFAGIDTFVYTMRDGDGSQSTATVTVTVTPGDDPPRVVGQPEYTVAQQSSLDVEANAGLLRYAVDDDGDALEVRLVSPPAHVQAPAASNFVVNADGSFEYVPDPAYGDDPGEDTDSFEVLYFDAADGLASAPVTVLIRLDAVENDVDEAPSGEVENDLDLADVPLEDAIAAEANVLVVMDDSGSMDWSLMTVERQGEFVINNSTSRTGLVPSRSRTYRYVHDVASNAFGDGRVVPTEEALAADADFAGNDYGVWRARNPQYNTVYYNPEIQYRPWRGLDRNGEEFAEGAWPNAVLDPFDVAAGTADLSALHTYESTDVPTVHGPVSGQKAVVSRDVYYAHYYRTTAARGTVPEPGDIGTRVAIDGTFPITLEDGSLIGYYPGGSARSDCAAADGDPLTCSFAEERRNFANWFTYYRSREYTAKAALGEVVAQASNIRLGYAAMNDAGQRLPVESLNASFRAGHKKAVMDQIYAPAALGPTPLRAALDGAGRYFECRAGDLFGSRSSSSPGDPECPVLPAPDGQCQNNFTLLFSDGQWTDDVTIADVDSDGSSAFDGGMFADSVASTLADVAMHYYERDLHALENRVPVMANDRARADESSLGATGETMHQHMKTYTIGLGLEGSVAFSDLPVGDAESGTTFSTPFAWSDPFDTGVAKVDDMLHAAMNGRGDFLQANDPVTLSGRLLDAFQQFSEGAVSVSALTFNSGALRENTVEYRAFFNLKFSSGDLRAYEVDPFDGSVDLANPLWRAASVLDGRNPASRVITTFDRLTGQGIPFEFDSLNAAQREVLDETQVDWLRGVRSAEDPAGSLRAREPDHGLLGDIVHSAPIFIGGPRAFQRDQAPFPTAASELYSRFASDRANRQRIVYVAANDGMLHAFDAGDSSDDPGTGNEVMAYVPNKIIDGSARFANRLDQLTSVLYSHRFFVDLTPTIEDVYMKSRATSSTRRWNTLLVGGLGGGGKGYYALDITDPRSFSAAGAPGTVLWEFTDDDDTYPVDASGDAVTDGDGNLLTDLAGQPARDLGYAFSQARIAMSNAENAAGGKEWIATFGNGYNSTAGIATLFVLFVERGLDGWSAGDFVKLSTGEGARAAPDVLAGRPNGLGEPALVDVDLNGTVDRAYAGDLFGNLYRFDLSATDARDWTVTKLFQATRNGTLATRQPITKRPHVVKHPAESGFIVVTGTGSYVTDQDGTSTEIQSLYGIWDRDEVEPATADPASRNTRLVEQTMVNVIDQAAPFSRQRVIDATDVVYAPDGGGPGTYGWVIDFDMPRASTTTSGNPSLDFTGQAPPLPQFPGERAIRRFVPNGDALIVTTVIPHDANACLRGPPGAVFPIDPVTGASPARPVFDVNNDGRVDEADLTDLSGESLAAGILFETSDLDGTIVDPSVLLGAGDNDFLFLSGGDDQILLRIAGPDDEKTGRRSWQELPNAQ